MKNFSVYKKYFKEAVSTNDPYSYLKSLYLQSDNNKNPYLEAYSKMLSNIYNELFPTLPVTENDVLGNIRNMERMIQSRDIHHALIDDRNTLYTTIINADQAGDIGTKAWFDSTVGGLSARTWGEHLWSAMTDLAIPGAVGGLIGHGASKLQGATSLAAPLYKGLTRGQVGGATAGIIGIPFGGDSNYFDKIYHNRHIDSYIEEARSSIRQLEEMRTNEFEMRLKSMGITHEDLKKIRIDANTANDFDSALKKADMMIHPDKYVKPSVDSENSLKDLKFVQIMFYLGIALVLLGIVFICGAIISMTMDYQAKQQAQEEIKVDTTPQEPAPSSINIPQPATFESYDSFMTASLSFFKTVVNKVKEWIISIVQKIIPSQIHAILFGLLGIGCITAGGYMVYKSYEGAY